MTFENAASVGNYFHRQGTALTYFTIRFLKRPQIGCGQFTSAHLLLAASPTIGQIEYTHLGRSVARLPVTKNHENCLGSNLETNSSYRIKAIFIFLYIFMA